MKKAALDNLTLAWHTEGKGGQIWMENNLLNELVKAYDRTGNESDSKGTNIA